MPLLIVIVYSSLWALGRAFGRGFREIAIADRPSVCGLNRRRFGVRRRPSLQSAALVEPVFTWTGFYVGAQIGGAWAKSDWTYQNINPYDSLGPAGPITGSANSFSMSALAGGVQFGFNYQINRLVLGVEGSWTATGLSQTNPNVVQVV